MPDILDIPLDSVALTDMRVHELALQAWLNRIFKVREGYPMPVVMASPMDAFAHFQNLWKADQNPFSYLLGLKDAGGKPLYEPHPSPPRYPLVSAYRRGWAYAPQRSMGYRENRRVAWPTVNGDADPNIDLHTVLVAREPMAIDFKFQIDHFCLRPDSQARFLHQLFREFSHSGAVLETWTRVVYPTMGAWPVRIAVDGEPANSTPEDGEQGEIQEFRTSFGITVEGWSPDILPQRVPTLWTMMVGSGTVEPGSLSSIYADLSEDLRDSRGNPVKNSMVPDTTT